MFDGFLIEKITKPSNNKPMNVTISRESLLAPLQGLSRNNKKWIADQLYEQIGEPRPTKRTTAKPRKKHSGISPSNDPWFDDPRNIAMLNQAVEESKNDPGRFVTMSEISEMLGL